MRSLTHPDTRRSRRVALAAVLMLLAGCGAMPTRPYWAFEPKVAMTLTVSSDTGDPNHPIAMLAKATNVGFGAVYISATRDVAAPFVAIYSPDRGNINACRECPNSACASSPERILALKPGESIEVFNRFFG